MYKQLKISPRCERIQRKIMLFVKLCSDGINLPVQSIKWNRQLNCLKAAKTKCSYIQASFTNYPIFQILFYEGKGADARDQLSMYLEDTLVSQMKHRMGVGQVQLRQHRLLSIKTLVVHGIHSSFRAMPKVGKFGFVVQLSSRINTDLLSSWCFELKLIWLVNMSTIYNLFSNLCNTKCQLVYCGKTEPSGTPDVTFTAHKNYVRQWATINSLSRLGTTVYQLKVCEHV